MKNKKLRLRLPFKIILICLLTILLIKLINSNLLMIHNLLLYFVVSITLIKNINDLESY